MTEPVGQSPEPHCDIPGCTAWHTGTFTPESDEDEARVEAWNAGYSAGYEDAVSVRPPGEPAGQGPDPLVNQIEEVLAVRLAQGGILPADAAIIRQLIGEIERLRAAAVRPPGDEAGLRAALEQALDRFETIGNHLRPDATDEDKHAVAQAWWFGSEEVRAALAAKPDQEEPADGTHTHGGFIQGSSARVDG